ncbi:ABC transporter substrate-binding protein [Rhodococcoides kyotonense]|uniref:Iron complex transport system substrate-binding protein n=1 Tax=Rhodococcoides kyotonense TaxID=398843 RepID=A0A239N2S1_9NOCA|nr:ABC transporter substrate-binding protein [Rhodococcus kyotonensis]SNT49165.1 iron complex transport system substrate-binding protein [Rhodococcus kyotonensis]
MRHKAITTAVLTCAAVLLGACSSVSDAPAAAPVMITLPDGRQVTIDGTPERIVTLGGQWTDVALSYGITPVGYYDALETATGDTAPWFGAELSESTAIDPNGDLVEQIAALQPDLIVAPGFAAQASQFDKLSEIAPTIDKISGEQIDPWEDMVTLMGVILHEPAKGQSIVDDVNTDVADLAAEYPGLAGKSYSFAFMYGPDQIQAFGSATDGAAQLFSTLGLVVAPALADETAKTGQPRFPISVENVPLLNSDLLVMSASTPELEERLVGLPSYANLDAVRSGAVSLLSQTDITAINEPSPTSIPYVFDKMRPALAAAAAG